MKKRAAFISLVLVAFGLFAGAASAEEGYAERLKELQEDPNYISVHLKAKEIKQDGDVITFQNAREFADNERRDTNTYVIDRDTVIKREISSAFADFEDFISGKAAWVGVFIPKNQYWETEKVENQRIHIELVSDFSKYITFVEKADEAFSRLASYEIMTKDDMGSFCPEEIVSRAEMAKILMKARNVIKLEAAADFTDVPANHWAKNYIGNAEKFGYINGYGDGTFAPDGDVTGAQAVKMIVCLLGYEPMAQARGGYPYGYVRTAMEIGLLGELGLVSDLGALDMDSPCTRETVAVMMGNALDIPLMMQTFYGADASEYAVFDGKEKPLETLLSYYWEE